MKKLKKYTALYVIAIFCSFSSYGMFISKKYQKIRSVHKTIQLRKSSDGIITATMPQRASSGVLGDFRLDKEYGVRCYLAKYLVYDINHSTESAPLEGFQTTVNAFQRFMKHNSSDAIIDALNDKKIDTEYAVKSLYFTYKIVEKFGKDIVYDMLFADKYSNDPERYIWVDRNASNKDRSMMMGELEKEEKNIEELIDFLQQKPINKKDSLLSSSKIFKKPESSSRYFFNFKSRSDNIAPTKIAHMHNGVLGNFALNHEYTIQQYLQKYLEKNDDKIEWHALKEAYSNFLAYNAPSVIQDSFNTELWGSKLTAIGASSKDGERALLFTKDVARAMQRYLQLDDLECFTLQKDVNALTNNDVYLFAKLGKKPADVAQTWDGILGNFVSTNKPSTKIACTIQDYLQKYIARNLQIPEEVVKQNATFLDIKKAFEQFIKHNHPQAIMSDFMDELISKQDAKDALEFTFWVVCALQDYLNDFDDNGYEQELFDLYWQIQKIEKLQDMRFMEKGEWRSINRE